MSAFAIVLLSETMFGGAQKRFLNLHLYLRKKYGESAWLIVTPTMKLEIEQSLGTQNCQGIFAIGESKQPTNEALVNTTKPNKKNRYNFLKSSLFFDLYFYLKSRKNTEKQFKLIDQFANEKGIDRFLAVYTGVLPLYFYLNKATATKRIVFSNMDSWFSHFEENKIKRFLRQYVLFHRAHEESNHIDFLSPFILSGLKSKNYLPSKQSYSITSCSFIDYSKCFVGSKTEMEFVFSGRLEEDKNPLMFMEAAIKLSNKYSNVKFHILGKGRLSNKIDATLNLLENKNIQCHGYVSEPCEIFANSSVFVSLQKENNYPSQSVLEAMACGNAIIATDVGDTRLFINDDNGWLINNSLEELISSMEYCINHQEEVFNRGQFATNYVRENFSIEKASAYYYSLLYPENNEK
jgi:glycosyltransferase involved in cell wall biosynthesis